MRFLPLCVSLFFLCACNKDSNTPPDPTKDYETHLMASIWTAFYESVEVVGTSDFERLSPECDDDNTWLFSADGTYVFSEAAELCDPDFPITEYPGTFELNIENQTILFDANAGPSLWDILTLNADTLLLQESPIQNRKHRILLTR